MKAIQHEFFAMLCEMRITGASHVDADAIKNYSTKKKDGRLTVKPGQDSSEIDSIMKKATYCFELHPSFERRTGNSTYLSVDAVCRHEKL